MKVKELIEFLKNQPQDIEVVYSTCSEQCILNAEDMYIKELCEPRPDGWVQDYRKDKPSQTYLVLPA
jgi:hypothetical protein